MAEYIVYLESAVVREDYPENSFAYNTNLCWGRDGEKTRAFFKPQKTIDQIFADLGYQIIHWADIVIPATSTEFSVPMQLLISSEDAGNLSSKNTWNTQPEIDQIIDLGYPFDQQEGEFNYVVPAGPVGKWGQVSDASYVGAMMLNKFTGVQFARPSSKTFSMAFPAPYIRVSYEEGIVAQPALLVTDAPTSGWVNRFAPTVFKWRIIGIGHSFCKGDFGQTSATLYWRDGPVGGFDHSVSVTTEKEIVIPANTFPQSSQIWWSVIAYAEDGTRVSASGYHFSTEDTLATATPISPVNQIVSANDTITFAWSITNDSGSTPTGSEIQFSEDGDTWGTAVAISGAAGEYTAPANSFESGNLYWRVRAKNADNVFGNWSAAAAAIVIGAPAAPIVNVEAVPFTRINWQSEGQEAWRVTVDEKVYGPYFGGTKSFTLPDFLSNGQHTVRVETQGRFGLWSQPGEKTFSVSNAQGDPVTLSGSFERDAVLSWETVSQTADFLIYRDGVRIGHTSRLTFTDRTTLGYHTWQVINRLPSGNYTASNTVQGVLNTEELAIALLSGGEWLELTKSRNPTRQEIYTLSQNIMLTHFAGQEYPEAEASPYKTLQGNFDVSWNRDEPEQAAAFEAMIGKPIIYKAPSGETLVGILAAIQKNPVNFFKAYTATVQRIHWRDFTDADN